eukprot:CAMPEP_0113567090 /NCGR_PEP_ID=MMETSP0015_2-20120614/23084_1 /TAXON_ID=2838 /ORGANISM="Odontella" /LENGTH=182 /DNA_ID=CAMNT_0000469449 /DNA_START=48 /DNA_END=596 /DNA_ORIENTATION=+ /assembly_acc=CAM_ASM_000160
MTEDGPTEEEGGVGYIKTAAHNYVSRKATVHGAGRVEMRGKSVVSPGAQIHGELGAPVRIGRYCHVGEGAVLCPPEAPTGRLPQIVGSNTRIGARCVVEAAAVGSSVIVGEDCTLGSRCIVKDCCRIENGTVVAPDTVIPPFSVVAGRPGKVIGELPESAAVELVDRSLAEYTAFVKVQEAL